jgi:CRISPR/Cas system CSM-associated protein Csm3 (group 7 of RAMP superfamily)
MNPDRPLAPKPYDFVAFPDRKPSLTKPIGHDRYHRDRLHGSLNLNLQVQTALHVSTGITGLGSDVGSRLPLIKTMTTTDQQLVIQGSSLKGCLRSVYEAITNSTLAEITHKAKDKNRIMRYYDDKFPRERKPLAINLKAAPNEHKLCPASRIFGALNYQGLLEFSDVKCLTVQPSIGFMPCLHSPDLQASDYYDASGKVIGRKFYYNMTKTVDAGEHQGIPVQQASRLCTFKTTIHYKNLLPEELGILFLILGQDARSPIALKVGGGKPIGMGTMTTTITTIAQVPDVRDRYRNYVIPNPEITGTAMQQFIQTQITAANNSQLLEKAQWQQLAAILKYPGDHQPPEGMY